MGFDLFPSDAELIAFFEVEPETFAELVITYTHVYNGETLYCSFTPEHGDLDVTLLLGEQKKAELHFSYGQQVTIDRFQDGREHLRVTFPPAMRLRDFVLTIKPEVSFFWGTQLDMDND
jgi:hypothetical protein